MFNGVDDPRGSWHNRILCLPNLSRSCLKLTAKAPENGWLEYYILPYWVKRPIFRGYVKLREGIKNVRIQIGMRSTFLPKHLFFTEGSTCSYVFQFKQRCRISGNQWKAWVTQESWMYFCCPTTTKSSSNRNIYIFSPMLVTVCRLKICIFEWTYTFPSCLILDFHRWHYYIPWICFMWFFFTASTI